MQKFIFILGLIFLSSSAFAQKLPEEIAKTFEDSSKWLNALDEKYEEDVVKVLGEPTKRSTWEINGQNQLLLEYKYGELEATIQLYFVGNRVVTVSFFQQSK